MKTITEVAKMLNITCEKLYRIIKNENLQLDKSTKKFRLSNSQVSCLIEKYNIEYIYIESKMNEPEKDTHSYYSRQEFIDKGFILEKQ